MIVAIRLRAGHHQASTSQVLIAIGGLDYGKKFHDLYPPFNKGRESDCEV